MVKRDDLIRKVWGRDNVSDHQMAQIIRAARQALGDDGNCQCMIRTVMGVGYHWAAEIVEFSGSDPVLPEPTRVTPMSKPSDIEAPTSLALIESAPDRLSVPEGDHPESDSLLPAPAYVALRAGAEASVAMAPEQPLRAVSRLRSRAVAALAAAMLLAVSIALFNISPSAEGVAGSKAVASVPEATANSIVAPAEDVDPVAELHALLAQGRFDAVRTGLAQLPDALAESADARLLDIELNIETGRLSRAVLDLKTQQARAVATGDRVMQAQLLILDSRLQHRSGAPKPRSLAMAQAAIALLESIPAAPELLARAEFRLAGALLLNGQPDRAALGFTKTRDVFLKLGDQRQATKASCGLARVWMRQGRLMEALEKLEANASVYAELDDPVSELFARNTALRLQLELLRFPEALASSDRAMRLLERAPDSGRRFRTLQLRAMALTGLGRLREAESVLDDADARHPANQATGGDRLIPAMHQLASAHYTQALDSAAVAFDALPSDPQNILLDSPDGALLLWVMAAQGVASQGLPLPVPSAPMHTALQKPESTLSRIAAGRWLWANGQRPAAHSVLNKAMADARQQRLLLRMLLAGNSLINLLIEGGQPDAAAQVLAAMRTEQPDRIDQSREIWSLEKSLAGTLTQRD